MLNFPRFDSETEVDPDHCAQVSGFTQEISESNSADDRTISQASAPSPAAISEYKDGEDENVEDDQQHDGPAEANSPEPREPFIIEESDEDVEEDQQHDELADANSPESNELSTIYECDEDAEDGQEYDEPAEANSPEPREPFTIEEYDEDFEEDQQHDEPAEANSPESNELSIIYECDEDAEDDQENAEPAEANSPEPTEPFTIEESNEDVEDDQQHDELAEANSPEPREPFTIEESDGDVEEEQQHDEPAESNSPESNELSTIYECDEDAEDGQEYDEPAEANSPEPREPFTIEEYDEDFEEDQQHDEPAEANSPESNELSIIYECDEDAEDGQEYDEPAEANSPEPREPFTIEEYDEDFEEDQQHDEPAEANSPESNELSIIYECDEDAEDGQEYDEPAEANSPEPREPFTIEEYDEDFEEDQQHDEPAEANSPESNELSTIDECDEGTEDDQEYDEPAEANSPESSELSTIYECDEEVEDDQKYDEPAEVNSPEPQQLSPIRQSHPEFDSDHQNDEPSEVENPEPRRLSHLRLEYPVPDYDGGEMEDDLSEAKTPSPRRIFPVHQWHSTLHNSPERSRRTLTFCPASLRRFLEPAERLEFDAFNDWFVKMNGRRNNAIDAGPEHRRNFAFRNTSPVPTYGDDEEDDDPFRAESPAPRRLFPVHRSHYDPPQSAPQMQTFCPAPLRRFLEPEERRKFDEFEDWFVRMHTRAESPAPRRLFPVHRSQYEPPQSAPQMQTFCPAPLRRFLEPEERLKFDAFEDWFVRMHEAPVRGDDEPSRAESPAPRRLFPVHRSHYEPPQSAPQMQTFCPAPLRRFLEPEERLKFDAFEDWFVRMHEASVQEDDEPRAESPAPRRLFPVHRSQYDPPQSAPQMQTFCPAPLRRFLEPEERLKFDAFEDWFVRMHEARVRVDDEPSRAESPAPRRLFPVHRSHYDPPQSAPQMQTFCPAPLRRFLEPEERLKFDEFEDWFVLMHEARVQGDDEPSRAESPAPRRLFPVHRSHYDPPQSAPHTGTFCPAPLRRFLEPEERLKFDAFNDWFVNMHMSRHTAFDACPEPRRPSPLRHESPVPKCDNNGKYHESFEEESPEPRQFFPVHQSYSWLNEPYPDSDSDDEALERMEYIPVEELRL